MHHSARPEKKAEPGCSTWRTGQDCHNHKISEIASNATAASRNITVQRLNVGSLRGAMCDNVLA